MSKARWSASIITPAGTFLSLDTKRSASATDYVLTVGNPDTA